MLKKLNPNKLIKKELLKKGKKQCDISGSFHIKKEKFGIGHI